MAKNIYDDILSDARVKLTEMFKDNFRGQGFFGDKWVATKVSKTNKRGRGFILIVTGPICAVISDGIMSGCGSQTNSDNN